VHRPITVHLVNLSGTLAVVGVNFTHHLPQTILESRSNLSWAIFTRVEMTKMINIAKRFSTSRKGCGTRHIEQWPYISQNRLLKVLKIDACISPGFYLSKLCHVPSCAGRAVMAP
jgi:hypothetical protein